MQFSKVLGCSRQTASSHGDEGRTLHHIANNFANILGKLLEKLASPLPRYFRTIQYHFKTSNVDFGTILKKQSSCQHGLYRNYSGSEICSPLVHHFFHPYFITLPQLNGESLSSDNLMFMKNHSLSTCSRTFSCNSYKSGPCKSSSCLCKV